ncbi:hypothetical protein [Hyphomonas sp.]|uniref:hypothetical protein n=1 Tax=Hyphomonas sp. TaxID=87 RepID=UPI003241C921
MISDDEKFRAAYSTVSEYVNYHERLIDSSVAPYITISFVLAGAIIKCEWREAFGVWPAIGGLIISVIWFLRAYRWRLWMLTALRQVRRLEKRYEVKLGRGSIFKAGQKKYALLFCSPSSALMTISLYAFGVIAFLVAAIILAMGIIV